MNCAQKKQQLGHPKFLQSSLKKLQQRHLLMKNLDQHPAKSNGWEKIVNPDMDFLISAWYQIRIPGFLPDQNLPRLMRDYQKKPNTYREIDLKPRQPKAEEGSAKYFSLRLIPTCDVTFWIATHLISQLDVVSTPNVETKKCDCVRIDYFTMYSIRICHWLLI